MGGIPASLPLNRGLDSDQWAAANIKAKQYWNRPVWFRWRNAHISRSTSPSCSMPGFPVFLSLPVFAQTHVHWADDAIQQSHPLLSPFSSCPQSFPVSGSFPLSQLFESGNWSIGAWASVLPVNIQDWFLLELTGLISLLSKGHSRVFSNTTVQKHHFFLDTRSLRFLLRYPPANSLKVICRGQCTSSHQLTWAQWQGLLFSSQDRLLELEGTWRLSSPVVCRLFLF